MLKQYCTERISLKANAFPFMTVREEYKPVCHLKQSNTKGIDSLDGKILKILRLSAPFIVETLTYIYSLSIDNKNTFPQVFKEAKVIPSSNPVTNRILQTLDPFPYYLFCQNR